MMEFRIADTFTDSLARLSGEEQKAVKTAAFDLQLNPASPGLSFHRIDKSKDKNFWSIRVGSDIRLIVHKTTSSFLLCYVDHHDKAYAWAERRKLETHPKTGAAQLVEIRERVEEIAVPVYVEVARPKPPKTLLFANLTDEVLLSYGVPVEWLSDVRQATEDSVLNLSDHLPSEAAEALLELATGGKPRVAQPVPAEANPFAHPDALRRFRVMNDVEELERAFTYPWDKWTIFIHPAQRELVERDYSGPARVSGSAGTGKTIVALHRAAFLARANAESRVLLTTFSETLADALRTKLRRLISNQPRLGERLEVHAINAIGERLYEQHFGHLNIASPQAIRTFITQAAAGVADLKFGLGFLLSEWDDIVDAWQLQSWESYRDIKRLGRKTRLQEAQRAKLWEVLNTVLARLRAEGLITHAEMFTLLADQLASRKHPPFEFVVVDEAQDLTVPQIKFLAALGGKRLNSLFFAGDLGQRIFQHPFSWKSLGVDIRGRSSTLHINYRTSHQIRMQTDRLLAPEVADVDGNTEDRRGTVSVFNGPAPLVRTFKSQDAESNAVGSWLADRVREGCMPHEIGVFVRSVAELDRARTAVSRAGLECKMLDEHVETTSGQVSIGTMYLAKGLEFRVVAVMCCDDEIVPLQSRIETVADDSDLEEIYNTERHLLYVACTRARDHLLVTSVEPASEFLDDLQLSGAK
jgi:superfamily I DNA/RNA helicase/mRNA-degrading endonuclease RelE of RelBE toxin-antitoxin system